MKRAVIFLAAGVLLAALYLVEMNKIGVREETDGVLTLDDLQEDASGELWDLFYKVRVVIIDGQSASFDIPAALKEREGELMEICGFAAFRGDGARPVDGQRVAVLFFDLMPLLSMTYGCEITPEVSMRWTLVVNLREEWVLTREEMINAEVSVRGRFRIDTSRPYNAAFFIDDATSQLVND